MKKNLIKSLSKKEQNELYDALNYLNMQEIKKFCTRYGISLQGKKGPIIQRIKHYLETSEIKKPKAIPEVSKSRDKETVLKPQTLILHGAYKNDLKTRIFMKALVGPHFHFTANGQDWLLSRWLQGKPPTYAEFAQFWQKDYLRQKNTAAKPRKEWAYLNFLQRFQKLHPQATRSKMVAVWKAYRKEQAHTVKCLLAKAEIIF